MAVNTPASMDMEATMEITCTEGNEVAMVSVFGQHLSKNTTNKYMLFRPIKWCITHPIKVCDGGYRKLETSILELTSYANLV